MRIFGPSDRIRTCGILLPKQARYQLRYTRKYSIFKNSALSSEEPSCGAQNFLHLGAVKNFDRYASFCSFNRPQDALATSPKAGALPTALHPEIFNFQKLCSQFRGALLRCPKFFTPWSGEKLCDFGGQIIIYQKPSFVNKF